MNKLFNIFGWLGVFFITAAYALISFSIIASNNIIYQLLNLLGAGGIVFSSYIKRDMQPVVLNIFWGLIALIALINLMA